MTIMQFELRKSAYMTSAANCKSRGARGSKR